MKDTELIEDLERRGQPEDLARAEKLRGFLKRRITPSPERTFWHRDKEED